MLVKRDPGRTQNGSDLWLQASSQSVNMEIEIL